MYYYNNAPLHLFEIIVIKKKSRYFAQPSKTCLLNYKSIPHNMSLKGATKRWLYLYLTLKEPQISGSHKIL